MTTKAISHFQADHILTRFVFPPLNEQLDIIIKASSPSAKPVRNIRLNIQTFEPLKSEAEIDEYLQGLKKQLMKFIDNNCEVMVTK